ncbi:MAG: hypothetical protein U0414_16115 [Polyangiaceae bacterium]
MHHVTFALFRRPREARDALRQLDREFSFDDHVKVLVGSAETPASDLTMSETHAGSAFLHGALYGLLSGALVGVVAALVGLRWFHFDGSTAIFTPVAGMFFGAFAGFLFGSINPNTSLWRLRRMARTGGVIITVEAESEKCTHRASEILKQNHGYLKAASGS